MGWKEKREELTTEAERQTERGNKALTKSKWLEMGALQEGWLELNIDKSHKTL